MVKAEYTYIWMRGRESDDSGADRLEDNINSLCFLVASFLSFHRWVAENGQHIMHQ